MTLVGLDIGSSSAKAIRVRDGRAGEAVRRRFPTRRGPGGRVEHDGDAIVRAAAAVLRAAAGDLGPVEGRLGIACQRSTVLLWDRDTGRPLTPALSWQDVRAASLCRRLVARRPRPFGDRVSEAVAARTGLRLSPHYSAPKLAWLLRRSPRLRRAVGRGRALWGTLSTYLVWRLTEGVVYAIDHANAQRTLLFNLRDLSWDADLFELFGLAPLLDAPALPAIVPTRWDSEASIAVSGRRLRLAAATGDQQAALLGLRCRREGDITINYGSGAFVLRRTGARPVQAPGLLTTLVQSWRRAEDAGRPGGYEAAYAVEGTVNAAATAIEWAERRLRLRVRTSRLDAYLADGPRPCEGPVHFLPAIAGLGAPRWDAAEHPRFAGRVAGASRRERMAAVIESIAQRCAEIVRDAGDRGRVARSVVRVSGGLTRCRWLLQAQADLLGRPVEVGDSPDATALGAALEAAPAPLPAAEGRAASRVVVRPRLSLRRARARARQWERAVYGGAAAG